MSTDRERLAAALEDLTYRGRNMTASEAGAYARTLMPVVDAIAAERAAAELRALSASLRRGASSVPDLTGRQALFASATGVDLRADAIEADR